MAKKQAPADRWTEIASFYAGRPVKIANDPRGDMGATTGQPESGNIFIGKGIEKGLADFMRELPAAKKGNKDAMHRAAVLGSNAIAVLIHESIHNRNFAGPPDGNGFTPYLDEEERGPLGFYGAGNEVQAAALGAELIPDMLNRFFGIPLDSAFSKKLAKIAKHRGEYEGAYSPGRILPSQPMAPTTPMPSMDEIFGR